MHPSSNRVRNMSERSASSSVVRDLKTPLIIAAAILVVVILAVVSHKLCSSHDTPSHPSQPFPFPPPTNAHSYPDTSFSSITPLYHHPSPPSSLGGIHPPSPITPTPPPAPPPYTFGRRLARIGALARVDSLTGYQLRTGVVSACDAVARGLASLRKLQPVRQSRGFSFSLGDYEEGRWRRRRGDGGSSGGGGGGDGGGGDRRGGSRTTRDGGMELRTSWDPLLSPRGSVASPGLPPMYGLPYRGEPAVAEVDLGVVERDEYYEPARR